MIFGEGIAAGVGELITDGEGDAPGVGDPVCAFADAPASRPVNATMKSSKTGAFGFMVYFRRTKDLGFQTS